MVPESHIGSALPSNPRTISTIPGSQTITSSFDCWYTLVSAITTIAIAIPYVLTMRILADGVL